MALRTRSGSGATTDVPPLGHVDGVEASVLVLHHQGLRPGADWHRHGTTPKILLFVDQGRLQPVLLLKQRWRHVSSGTTRHDRPFWDVPNQRFAADVVVLTLAAWLVAGNGLHHTDWPWASERPARRTVQRWAAHLAPHAGRWLQHTRERILDFVAPRPLEDLLPTGGIPPPRRVRAFSQENVHACKLRDVVWLIENVAQSLSILVADLLGVARWRWPSKLHNQRTA